MVKKLRLREISWGWWGDCDRTAIYCTGRVPADEFLAAVRQFAPSDVPLDARAALKTEEVEHVRFRPLSPSEARSHGVDWGVEETSKGGYAVTKVTL